MTLRMSKNPAVFWFCAMSVSDQKITLRMITSTSERVASGTVRRYQGYVASAGSTRSSRGVSEYTSPTSSALGFGCVTSETTTESTMSTTNAADAATNDAPCPERFSTPVDQDPNASS